MPHNFDSSAYWLVSSIARIPWRSVSDARHHDADGTKHDRAHDRAGKPDG
jgi:hypothetical protein